jgi:lipoate---protein ligase
MNYLHLTFANDAANLACDEVLLELYEDGQISDGCLRIWQPENYFVVLGHANRLSAEVKIEACTENHIAILRRISGGGAILQGPGCFNYSLILDSQNSNFRNIGATFDSVLRSHCRLFQDLCGAKTEIEGTSDLTVAGRKFSGNAQYRKSRFLLIHGTFLLHFDLRWIERCLRMPSKQPAYRRKRSHLEFIINLEINTDRVNAGLRDTWQARDDLKEVPLTRIDALVRERYGNPAWSAKF